MREIDLNVGKVHHQARHRLELEEILGSAAEHLAQFRMRRKATSQRSNDSAPIHQLVRTELASQDRFQSLPQDLQREAEDEAVDLLLSLELNVHRYTANLLLGGSRLQLLQRQQAGVEVRQPRLMEHLDHRELEHSSAILCGKHLQHFHAQLEPRRSQVRKLERALQEVALEAMHQLITRLNVLDDSVQAFSSLHKPLQGVEHLLRTASSLMKRQSSSVRESEYLLGDHVEHWQARCSTVVEVRDHSIDRRASQDLSKWWSFDGQQCLLDKRLQGGCHSLSALLGEEALNLDDRLEVVVRHQDAHDLHHHRRQQEAECVAHNEEDAADHLTSLKARTTLVHDSIQQRRAPRLTEAFEKLLGQVRVGLDDARHLSHSLLLDAKSLIELCRVHKRRELTGLVRCQHLLHRADQ